MKDEITANGETYRQVKNNEEQKSIEGRYEKVPSNIQFDPDGALLFNDDKQVLYEHHGEYVVWTSFSVSEEERFLVPCKRSELEPGDIALGIDSALNSAFKPSAKFVHFQVILDENTGAFVAKDSDVMVDESDFQDWYKVMTRKEIRDMEAELR